MTDKEFRVTVSALINEYMITRSRLATATIALQAMRDAMTEYDSAKFEPLYKKHHKEISDGVSRQIESPSMSSLAQAAQSLLRMDDPYIKL